ncbi:hypothetical protein OVA24_11630 [Luteolibacter sp. SL250]|uniref:hypothetical protein n=1 Tax=Luteolibacter sp. SL250 TaxID=2995170 RepID=UPI00226E4B3D|nr:hypothetical protein [Luteolibacter sp. SL250]WAC17894.1 hypothetical protein OVA24_11630 [Luteolibacter sp. SL250]
MGSKKVARPEEGVSEEEGREKAGVTSEVFVGPTGFTRGLFPCSADFALSVLAGTAAFDCPPFKTHTAASTSRTAMSKAEVPE